MIPYLNNLQMSLKLKKNPKKSKIYKLIKTFNLKKHKTNSKTKKIPYKKINNPKY